MNIGDLSILEGLMEVKKQLFSLGPWVTMLLHPAKEEFLFFLFSVWGFFPDSSQRLILQFTCHLWVTAFLHRSKAKIHIFFKWVLNLALHSGISGELTDRPETSKRFFDTVTKTSRLSLKCLLCGTRLTPGQLQSSLILERFSGSRLCIALTPFSHYCFPRDLLIFLNLALQPFCEANTVQMSWPCSCWQESWKSREAFGRLQARSQNSHYKVTLIKQGESVFNYPFVWDMPFWFWKKFWHYTDDLFVTNSFGVSYKSWRLILFQTTVYS